ncbi:conserved protein of unknown function [Pseudodesulfovibrio profundus]|uniref:HhH-GPD domain-containing protein n=1 Tax=Pseudodesulfovibrio profundus TaxID=57320 RepID=A0A2C8F591_9BACT|nr:conserved protein of unknown function [Pseudodesulfovibrio profundus]
MTSAATTRSMYEAMLDALGPSDWWPGDTPFEVMVGAILTQNTNWSNVEKAISNLKEHDLLAPFQMAELPLKDLAKLIRPAGYYNVKARRLANLLNFLKNEVAYDIQALKEYPLHALRPKLLSINGIGPETADSILLYALEKPSFVIDAYTFRMMSRHGFVFEGMEYHELQTLFMDALPEDVATYNECHALIVRIGKQWCKKRNPLCQTCPLKDYLTN